MSAMLDLLRKMKRRLLRPSQRQQWPEFSAEEFHSLRSTFLESENWSGGAEVARFTEEFTRYLGVRYGVMVNSGTSALEIAIAASGIGPGDEVIVPSYTFYSSASCIAKVGAKPVFVDVRLEDACIDPAAVEMAVTSRTRAVIVVHFCGHPVDMESILRICKAHNLVLIEDAAHAAGSQWNGKPLGGIGDFGCFSFHSSKPLAAGEGGFIATNDAARYQTAQALADFGILPGGARNKHSILGSNVRISKFQAAILSLQLKKLDMQVARRERNVSILSAQMNSISGIQPMRRASYATKLNHYIYGFRYDPQAFGGLSKSDFANNLRDAGIPCVEGYESPLYDQPVFQSLEAVVAGQNASHENALSLCRSSLGLDQGFLLGPKEDMQAVARTLKNMQADGRR